MLSVYMFSICRSGGGRGFGDYDLQAGFAEVFDVPGIGGGVGDQNVDVGDWPDEGEALPAEFSVIGEGDTSLGGLGDHLLDLGFRLVSGRDAVLRVKRADAEEGLIEAYLRQGALRPLTGKAERVFLQIASGAENRDAGAALQLANDAGRIGDHGQAVTVNEATCQFEDGGAALEKDGVAIEDEWFGGLGDAPLFLAIAAEERIVGGLKIGARHAGNRPAMRANQDAVPFQSREVAANGGCGNAQALAQVGSGDGALGGQNFADLETPLLGQHKV